MLEGIRWVIYIALLGLLVFLVWSAVNKKQEIDNYSKGAVHNEVVENNWPLSIHPCGALFRVDGPEKPKVAK